MNLNPGIEHSPFEPEPKVHDRLDRAVRLFLRGLSPPHPRDTKARNFSAVRRFRTLVSQSTRAPEEETKRYVETPEYFRVIVKKSLALSLLWCSGAL
jgi:hypothetical protein